MINNKIFSLLSISAKAGKVASGTFLTEKALQEGTARLVIIATDASANTQKKFINKATYYKVPYKVFGDSEQLGKNIGRTARTSLAILDEGLANQILSKLNSKDMEV